LLEFAGSGGVTVHFPWHNGEIRTGTLDELLPYAFMLPSRAAP
jgi:hypothetical protein